MTEPNYWNVAYIPQASSFIFGFGSIINDKSRKSTVPDAGDAIPVRISPNFGYRRVWNFQSPSAQLTALGLIKNTPGWSINGIIYPVDAEAIAEFDKREQGYNRVEIPIIYIQSIGWQCLPEYPIKIWVYIPNETSKPPNKCYPILQTYVDVVILGCLKYGSEFAMEFLSTTGWWNNYWLNDRQLPRRPWLFQKRYQEVDNLLAEYSSHYGLKNNNLLAYDFFKKRKLPVEFSVFFLQEKETEYIHDPLNNYQAENNAELCFMCPLDN